MSDSEEEDGKSTKDDLSSFLAKVDEIGWFLMCGELGRGEPAPPLKQIKYTHRYYGIPIFVSNFFVLQIHTHCYPERVRF